VGEHDFAGFRAADCSATDTIRTLHRVEILRPVAANQPLIIEVEGTAFLKYMVRIIVGTLFGVATGDLPVGIVDELFASRARRKAGRTAPPHGLELMEVFYPDFPWERARWQLPPQ
jgi:tRNA pseudouridine38-40 synthase